MPTDISRLRGPGVEVNVRRGDEHPGSISMPVTYCIPKALLSHHSPCIMAAYDSRQIKSSSSVTFTFHQPDMFSLFNMWMYYGRYTPTPETGPSDGSADVFAWVLGDKLQSVDFKNYVMGRLYTDFFSPVGSRVVIPDQIDYICSWTKPDAKLRLFFLDILATHFSDEYRVNGTWEQWDAVFQKHVDARTFILRSFTAAPAERRYIKLLGSYFRAQAKTAGVRCCDTES